MKAAAPRLRFVRRVTRRHGAIFSEEWRARVMLSGELVDAFAATSIIAWLDDAPAQRRYNELTDEILSRTFAVAHDAIIAAFVQVANEVIARERAKGPGR